jgi:ABC-type multidrug transport system fused ATPase/permease subunit
MRDIWFLLAPVKTLLPLTLVLLFITQGLQLVVPYLWKLMIDTITALQTQPASQPLRSTLIALMAGSGLITAVINTIRRWKDHLTFDVLLRLERDLPVEAQAKLMDLSLGFHERQVTGKTIIRVERGVSRLVELMANGLFDVLPTLVQLIGTFAILAWLDWRVALIFSPAAPLFVWMTNSINRRAAPLRRQLHDLSEIAGGQLAQSLMNIHTVQSFSQQQAEVDRHRRTREQIYETETREWWMVLNANFWRDLTINLGRLVVLSYSVYLLLQHQISLGSLVLFASLTESAYLALFRMSRTFDRGAQWAEALGRLAKLLYEPLRVTEAATARPLGPMRGDICFDRVSFSYGGDRDSLGDVSFQIPAGTTTALVGPSGGGKTTVVRLLFRHYDPASGTVLIDGQPLNELRVASFREQMAIVPQEVEIFDLTVHENIAYARPTASREEVEAAAVMANADEFVTGLAHGYQTLVGERGVRLSGGQRQRIGIARAILTDPRILVFDEATSNLDSHSERQIQDALRRIRGQRTVLIVAHRLSTIRQADQIIVLQGGQLIECGTHDELVQQTDGVYAHHHGLQMETGALTPST